MKYIFAIDETGQFDIRQTKDKSFVCGVLVKGEESKLLKAYQNIYTEFGYPEPIPSNERELLINPENSDDNARFHFKNASEKEKEIYWKHLLPFVDKVYVSTNKPILCANNQNWWLIALTVVIQKFLADPDFKLQKDDEVEILIDTRAKKTWGVLKKEDANDKKKGDYRKQINKSIKELSLSKDVRYNVTIHSKIDPEYKDVYKSIVGEIKKLGLPNDIIWNIELSSAKQQRKTESTNEHEGYHEDIAKQIKAEVEKYVPDEVRLDIEFKSDTSSLYVCFADIVCGFARSNNRKKLSDKIVECSCKNFSSGLDPIAYKNDNPLFALNIIYQEVGQDKYDNISYVEDILQKMREDKDDYEMAWDMFYDFLKSEIAERETLSKLANIRPFVQKFIDEFDSYAKENLKSGKNLEQLILFVEYHSHIGSAKNPFERKVFKNLLEQMDSSTETRTLIKWERNVSYTLRETQIYFNDYNFIAASENLSKVWSTHCKLLSILKDEIYENDENATALIGSMGQLFALREDYETAKVYFEEDSKKYAIKSNSITDSYLFAIYHRYEDIANCRNCFRLVTGNTPEDYYKDNNFDKTWNLIMYCKLRALELYEKGKTTLPAINLEDLKNYNSEYPFPLAMKWEAIARCLEKKDSNISKAKKYFADAIANLLEEDNGFAIRTLALPIMQCFNLIDSQNPYYKSYIGILNKLKSESEYFADYVCDKPQLNDLVNDLNIWERALLLPFYYA